jgi:ubiquinone/menaquinone biosynthesis C-methylase UbiE
MSYKNNSSWDARTYDQVSYLVQFKWGQQALEWRKWHGDEIVMDAGCGSGLLTKQLAKRVPVLRFHKYKTSTKVGCHFF